MDIVTLVLVHAILRERGIRPAAKASGRPVATIGAALKRMEAAIAVPLVRREGGMLVPTLEAQRRLPDLAAADLAVRALMAIGATKTQARESEPLKSISFAALSRFIAIARAGSIRNAARHLGLGQPQMTRQLAELERNVGYALVTRSPSGISCTPQGLAAIPIAEELIDIWNRLSRASGDRFRRTAATWRLGAVMPLGPESEIARMLATVTAQWHHSHPRQPLFVSSTTADELIAGLKNRRFDAVLLDLQDFPAEFEGSLVSRAPLALAGSTAVIAARGRSARDILLSSPIAVPSVRSGLRQQATRFIEQTLSEPERRQITLVEVDSIPVIINLVLHHDYVSVLPEGSLARVQHPPAMLRLGADYMQSLSLVWQKNVLSRQFSEAILRMMALENPSQT